MRRYIAVEEVWDETEDFNGVDIESAMEEAEVMEEEARELAAEITADNAEAERAADLSDSLEDLAVVASSIDEATPAETQLIQLAGDMATAGDEEVTSEDIVPATESFVGQRIAVEGFVEKAKQIWEAIVWSYVIEYADFNVKKAYTNSLTTEGYHQGGLGVGLTNFTTVTDQWTSYNNTYPLTPCGLGSEYGNSSASITIPAITYKVNTIATASLSSWS